MAESPFNAGSGKPTVSRVPDGGGGALRPRPVRAPKKVSRSPETPAAKKDAETSEAGLGVAADTAEVLGDDSALWARLAAISARQQEIKGRAAGWSEEGKGIDG